MLVLFEEDIGNLIQSSPSYVGAWPAPVGSYPLSTLRDAFYREKHIRKHIWLVEYTPDGCNWEQISTISGLLMPWAMALGKNIQIATGYIILCEIQGRVFIIVYPPIVCHMCIQWVCPMYPKIIQNPLADCHRNCSPSKMVVFLGGVPPFR